ncbi:MAG: ribonuclease J [Eubacteriales bacterium]|nr:ribonuclease J [Eubacteriales bacterium]
MAKSKKKKAPKLRVIPLGGLGEIGKNMTVFEYEDDIIVVDMGSIFPKDDMPGIDLVIPDITYLMKNADRIRGYVLTHGHEDHIGASPYILSEVPAPVYGTKLTLAFVEHKLKEHRMDDIDLHVVAAGDRVRIGCFEVEFIRVSHSIAGAVAVAIHSPAGTVVHSGDFKVDFTPIEGEGMDFGRLAQLGSEGVMLLMCESTNVEKAGYTMSEKRVGETFMNLFHQADGRIIISMFASNIHRIQSVVDAAVRFNRKVCLVGRSMINNTKIAMNLGLLRIPEGRLLNVDEIDRYEDNELVVITTGSQGEPMSGLSRMAFAEHRKLEIKATDMVIISAHPIPGNEKSVYRIINQLVSTGANVVYEKMAEVHVSGHACQEELKLMHALVRPKYFIPVHGETRHLHQHARLAQEMGMDEKNVRIASIGQMIDVSADKMVLAGTVPSGAVLIDGLGVGDIREGVLRDRKHLSQDGMLIVVVAVDSASGMVVSGPDVISRGLVYTHEAEELVEGVRCTARATMAGFGPLEPGEWGSFKNQMRVAIQKFVFDTIKRNPMVLPIVVEVESEGRS